MSGKGLEKMTNCRHRCFTIVMSCIFIAAGDAMASSCPSYSNSVTVPQVDSNVNRNKSVSGQNVYETAQIPAGPNPSTLPYEKRAQRLPDTGPYNGRGLYNPDTWPAPTEYIGQDGTILYCDKKGNVYDSNGVRYGKRESDGQLRKLNKAEQLYDAAFNSNYADKAFKEEERKFKKEEQEYKKNHKNDPKSSFEDEIKQKGGGQDIQKLKAKGDGINVSFNSTVDEWHDDGDIAKAATVYSGSKDWQDYVRILDANIGYLEQVLKEGKGDASFVKLQEEEIRKVDGKINETIFNAKGWSKKDAAKVMQKMHEDYGIGGKLRHRLELVEEVNKRDLFALTENLPNESQVGVRGWCHCWDPHDHFWNCKWVGNGLWAEKEVDAVYCYSICIDCGRCYTTAKSGTAFSGYGADIFDMNIYRVWNAKLSREESATEREKIVNLMDGLMGVSRDKLLNIPDGEIVIRGSCKCKRPEPLKVGLKSREFSVCEICGKVYKHM